MPASALLLGASAAVRAASLNLCSDEYLLLLAAPGQIVSVSFLSRDAAESPLWLRARSAHGNDGTLESVIARRPSLVLTMAGSGAMAGPIARRLGIRLVALEPPRSLADVRASLARVAALLGDPRRAAPLIARIEALETSAPPDARDTIFLSGGGRSLASTGIGAQWLRLAGYRQRALPGARAGLETLIADPPAALIRSDYRAAQASLGNRWLDHPAVRRLGPRTGFTDGRRWTCMGPALIGEIERLRAARR